MKKQKLFCFLVLASVLISSGCVARTYPLTKDRVDQDLNTGNQGFLMGKAQAEGATPRKDTRTVRVFEIEFGKPYQAKQVNVPVSSETQGTLSAPEPAGGESLMETTVPEPLATSGAVQKYTVGKNDTLQKISKKFYGTSKNWMKIYRANTDVLKGPDKVYPGQVLNIPEVSKAKTPVETLEEPKENLK